MSPERVIFVGKTYLKYKARWRSATLDETIDNFKYDEQPQNEIRVWEHMARTVLALRYQLGWPPEKVAPAVKVVLGLSMGTIQDNPLDNDSTEQIIAIWNKRDPQ